MPVSDPDIVNAALRRLGGKRISSLTDGSKNANAANDIFKLLRDSLLNAHNWDFATRLVKLSRLSTAPTFGPDYAYALPADWIRTITVHDNDAGLGTVAYEEAEVDNTGALLASVENVYLRYVYRVTDPNRFSESFRTAFETALARDLALTVAGSNTLFASLSETAVKDLRRAKSVDSMGSPPRARPRGSWADSRQSFPSTTWPR